MPATAGRVRMPANNRVHSSAALQTHGIWQSAIGYDPYAPNKEDKKDKSTQKSSVPEPEGENAYASFQGLLALARVTGSNADEVRGACKKCGRVGHLTFQCRNFLSAKDEADREGKDPDAIQNAVLTGLEKLKRERVKGREKRVVESDESSDEQEESESSDSGYDSEIERAIAEKFGKIFTGGRSKASKNSKKDANESDEDRDARKRGRSKKTSVKRRGHSDSEDEEEVRRKKRKEKVRRRDEDSSDEEEERRRRRKGGKEKRRSHRHSDDDISDDSTNQRHKRRRRQGYSVSDSDDNGSQDSRVRRGKKRSGKKSRNHHRHEE